MPCTQNLSNYLYHVVSPVKDTTVHKTPWSWSLLSQDWVCRVHPFYSQLPYGLTGLVSSPVIC